MTQTPFDSPRQQSAEGASLTPHTGEAESLATGNRSEPSGDAGATARSGALAKRKMHWGLGTLLLIIFLVTRYQMWWNYQHSPDQQFVGPPVFYYFEGLDNPDSTAMREYPVPIMWLTEFLRFLTHAFPDVHQNTVALLFLAVLDVIFGVWLIGTKRWWGSFFWSLFGLIFGSLLWSRWDIIPAVFAAATIAALARHPRVSGFFLALATTIKLWPGVLLTGLIGAWNSRNSWKRLAWFAITACVVVALSIWDYGFDRITSVLDYQGNRGLQVESVLATVPLIRRYSGESAFSVSFAPSQSFEIFGPGVEFWTQMSDVLMAAMIIICLYLCLLAFLGLPFLRKISPKNGDRSAKDPQVRINRIDAETDKGWSPARAAWLILLITAAVILTNKVFSTQYVVWLAAPLAVCVDLTPGSPAATSKRSAVILRFSALLYLVVSGLTHYCYPYGYSDIIVHPEQPATLVLIVRNLALLLVFVVLLIGFYLEPKVRLLRLRDFLFYPRRPATEKKIIYPDSDFSNAPAPASNAPAPKGATSSPIAPGPVAGPVAPGPTSTGPVTPGPAPTGPVTPPPAAPRPAPTSTDTHS